MNDDMPSATEDKVVRGAALIHAIQDEAQRQGLSVKEVAEKFELAPSYWFSMCNGNRSIQALHRHRLKLIAKFLAKPYIEVLSLAELVEPEDFIIPQTIDDQLNLAYLKLKGDSMWAPLVPTEAVWDATARPMKILAIALYERLFTVSLLNKAQITQFVHAEDAVGEGTPSPAIAEPATAPARAAAGSKRSRTVLTAA
ncbi:hypothetical protein [Ottowia sp.]|uniref:hypothetical protein n=1 Tax=Ottowia sp. TaxID=1898956 RepID=UPI0025F7A01E|nr:hypothetical protein [Ottowia sp.]MBK6616203.1 hypothetical protein [Ottowia sp.]